MVNKILDYEIKSLIQKAQKSSYIFLANGMFTLKAKLSWLYG